MSLVISSVFFQAHLSANVRRHDGEKTKNQRRLSNNINASPFEKISVAEMLVVIYLAPFVPERNENGYQSIGPLADLQGFI